MTDSALASATDDGANGASARRLLIARRIILILSLLGALRVFAFAAAYPPFLFIDEALHFENVIKYTKVGLPDRADDRFDLDAARTIATHGVHGPGRGAAFSPTQRQQAIDELVARHAGYFNCETFTPPLYYALAAAGYEIGQFFVETRRERVLWLRVLSVRQCGVK
jgi:hypothetical protein